MHSKNYINVRLVFRYIHSSLVRVYQDADDDDDDDDEDEDGDEDDDEDDDDDDCNVPKN